MIQSKGINALPAATNIIEGGISQGLHFGAQVYVSLPGEVIGDFAIGTSGPDGAALTPGHLLPWYSNTKPVSAVAFATLVDQRLVSFDDPVVRFIPAFASGGKGGITIRHLLSHTAGFRDANLRDEMSWDETIAAICATPLEEGWSPGERAGYHAETSWFILGEIAQRVSGEPFADFVKQRVFEPLEMKNSYIGMTDDEFRKAEPLIAPIYKTERNAPVEWREAPDSFKRCNSGAGGLGPVRELARFYEMIGSTYSKLAEGPGYSPAPRASAGARILSEELVREMTTRRRIGMFDETFRHKMDWGLGFIVNSRRYGVETVPYGFGRYASDETFGHGGRQTSAAFCDPAHGLVAAAVFNGAPGEPRHARRMKEFLSAVYADLRLL